MTYNINVLSKTKHICFEERKMIEKLLKEKAWVNEIARILWRAHSSISDEIISKKPSYDCYTAELAQKIALRKSSNIWNKGRKIDKYPLLKQKIISWIKEEWSPEEISRRIKRFKDLEAGLVNISHESIYQFIYTDIKAKQEKLYLHLRRSRKHRKKRWVRITGCKTKIPERISIHERIENANSRKEFWHFESDSMIFSKQRQILSVQVDRMTRLSRLTLLPSKEACETIKALKNTWYEFDKWDNNLLSIKSYTFDNWTENMQHIELKRLFWIQNYFCDTYCSWQKATVENTNSLIRQYLPRNIDLSKITDDDIYRIQEKLNNRPRKCLNYLTPNEYLWCLDNPDFKITKPFP